MLYWNAGLQCEKYLRILRDNMVQMIDRSFLRVYMQLPLSHQTVNN